MGLACKLIHTKSWDILDAPNQHELKKIVQRVCKFTFNDLPQPPQNSYPKFWNTETTFENPKKNLKKCVSINPL